MWIVKRFIGPHSKDDPSGDGRRMRCRLVVDYLLNLVCLKRQQSLERFAKLRFHRINREPFGCWIGEFHHYVRCGSGERVVSYHQSAK